MPPPRPDLARTFAARLVVAAVGLCPSLAAAAPYEIFIDVDDEEDLQDLNNTGDISGETYETLVELMRRGIDLNRASREDLFTLPNLNYGQVDAILALRKELGVIADPAVLVAAGVLDVRTLESIAAFLLVTDPRRGRGAAHGRVRYRSGFAQADRLTPPMALDGQLEAARHLRVGFAAVLNRLQPSDVRWDPQREALSAEVGRPTPRLPKFFAQWDDDKWTVLAGTYRIGFGQRLTFDNTRNYTPNGIYRDQYIYPRRVDLTGECRESGGELDASPCAGNNTYITPDFRWQQTLQGAAFGLKRLDLPVGWMQAYGWFSAIDKDIYQYRLYNRDTCDDPRNDDDPACAAPDLYKRQDDLLAPAPALSFATLPRMYREVLAGSNVSYFVNRRTHVGVTGYGSTVTSLVKGAELDFQEWDRTPYGGPFGAVGVNGAWGRRWSDLSAEVTRSFDSMNRVTPELAGGGFAGLIRHAATWGDKNAHQIETIVRYYSTDYANPYARPLSSPDVYEGSRARDELGGRVLYQTRFLEKRANIRTYLNLWQSPSTGGRQLIYYFRGDYQVSRRFIPALWMQYQDKDLGSSGRGQCFGGDPTASTLANGDDDFEDLPLPGLEMAEPPRCRGEQLRANIVLKIIPHRRITITPRYQHRWIDDSRYPDRFRQDSQAWLTVNTRPIDPLRIRARVRYLFEDTSDDTYLEHSLWSYLSVGYLWNRKFLVQVRYDLYAYFDKRASTMTRRPSPENRLFLELEARF